MSVAAYEQAFHAVRPKSHPQVDAFEQRMGYAVDRERLEDAARVLACPVKKNPPSWQHGRVLYAMTLRYLAENTREVVTLLDIGTAKGFSALCLQWALSDSDAIGAVFSVDVIDPDGRVERNTVAECEGLKTLREILAPWPESHAIEFTRSTGRAWLSSHTCRVNVASVDGKHTYEEVSWEAALLCARQSAGDLIFFDDLQIDGVAKVVQEIMQRRTYDVEFIESDPLRRYAIARKL